MALLSLVPYSLQYEPFRPMQKYLFHWLILYTTITGGWQSLQAQQDAMFTQYMFNPMAINPAYTGSSEMLNIVGLFRKQWVGIEGAPTTGTLSLDAALRNQTMGLGLNLVADRIGIYQTVFAFASYAYRIKIGEQSRLSMGLQFGGSQFVADFAGVNTVNPDPSFQHAGKVSMFQPNVGGGLWFNTAKLFVGFGVPHIINYAHTPDKALEQARQYRHYFLLAGYQFDISAEWQLKPSMLLKAVEAAPIQLDLNLSAWYLNRIGAGISWRSMSSFSFMAGYQLSEQFMAGYAYDISTTTLRRYNNGSHELMLRYQLIDSRKRLISPRLF